MIDFVEIGLIIMMFSLAVPLWIIGLIMIYDLLCDFFNRRNKK